MRSACGKSAKMYEMDQNVAYELFKVMFPKWQRLALKPHAYHQDNISRVEWHWNAYRLVFITNIASLREAGLSAFAILTLDDELQAECDVNLLEVGAVDEMWVLFEKFIGVVSQ